MSLDTYRLYQNVVAAGTLYTPAMTTEVCETLGRATVPREVTPGLRPVMEIAAVPEDLINWSASRRQRIEDPLEVLTDQYVKDHRHPPGECGRHGLLVDGAGDPAREEEAEAARAAARMVARLRDPPLRPAAHRDPPGQVPGRGGRRSGRGWIPPWT
ncbi:relaxase domain-containing protein [Streptomyces eurythermus]|uniref:relaxase domain-containing protein n=1 Tax=Streptomyces eurythermus TaxID=42237 RepID=UPI0033C814ED